MGQWYPAECPIVSPAGGLGMSDYFGRTLVAELPDSIKIGVVAVAMGGSPIEMFDKETYVQTLRENPDKHWARRANEYYGGNPYQRLVDMGRKAQQAGVIKGILLHQGCSNNGDPAWPQKVKKIYEDLLADLGLDAKDVQGAGRHLPCTQRRHRPDAPSHPYRARHLLRRLPRQRHRPLALLRHRLPHHGPTLCPESTENVIPLTIWLILKKEKLGLRHFDIPMRHKGKSVSGFSLYFAAENSSQL